MIAWWWLLIVAFIAGIVGFFAAGLYVLANKTDLLGQNFKLREDIIAMKQKMMLLKKGRD